MDEPNFVATSKESNWRCDLPGAIDESFPYKSVIGSLMFLSKKQDLESLSSRYGKNYTDIRTEALPRPTFEKFS